MDQLRLDIPEQEPQRRRRRKAARPPARTTRRREAVTGQLLDAPVVQQCGFCGHAQTVQGETTICEHCGGIIIRDESDV